MSELKCATCGADRICRHYEPRKVGDSMLSLADMICTRDNLHETGFYITSNGGRVTPIGYEWREDGGIQRRWTAEQVP